MGRYVLFLWHCHQLGRVYCCMFLIAILLSTIQLIFHSITVHQHWVVRVSMEWETCLIFLHLTWNTISDSTHLDRKFYGLTTQPDVPTHIQISAYNGEQQEKKCELTFALNSANNSKCCLRSVARMASITKNLNRLNSPLSNPRSQL